VSFAFRARLAENESFSIFFRDSSSLAANTASTTIAIPSTIAVGDAMILIVGWSISSGQTFTTPTGWTVVGSQISDEGQVASIALMRVAQLGDKSGSVPLALSAIGNLTAVLSCYGNTDGTNPIDICSGVAEGSTATTTHTTPSVTLARQHDWVISGIVDKAATHTSTWTPPAGSTRRANAFNSSNPGVTSAIGDTASNVPLGTAGSLVWTADQSSSRAVMWTIGLKRAAHASGSDSSSGGSGEVLIGAASLNWTDMLAKAGTMNVSRTYDNGMSTDLPNYQYGTNKLSYFWGLGMTVAHTFKPDMALLAAQDATTMANLNTMLQSAQGQKMWWCLWHEPENDTIGVVNSLNSFSLSDYQAAWKVFADTMHGYNEPGWKSCWVMMSYTWKKSFLTANPSFTPDSWYPGDSYVDIVGIDDYNEGSLHNFSPGDGTYQRWDSPGFGWGDPDPNESLGPNGGGYYSPSLINWIAAKGKGYAICEFGTIRNLQTAMGRSKPDPTTGPYTLDWWTSTFGGDNSKANWIKNYTKYHMEIAPAKFGTNCVSMMYFDYNGRKWAGDGTESWELFHTPGDVDYTAWGDMLTQYGS
jgi:hypothetical protein